MKLLVTQLSSDIEIFKMYVVSSSIFGIWNSRDSLIRQNVQLEYEMLVEVSNLVILTRKCMLMSGQPPHQIHFLDSDNCRLRSQFSIVGHLK